MRGEYYFGLCDRLGGFPGGTIKAVGGGWLLAQGLNSLFNAVSANPEIFANADLAGIAALGGAFIGVAAHSALNHYLPGKGVSIRQGSKILQRVQAACYAIPVAASLAFSIVAGGEESQPYVIPPVSDLGTPSLIKHSVHAQWPSQFRLA